MSDDKKKLYRMGGEIEKMISESQEIGKKINVYYKTIDSNSAKLLLKVNSLEEMADRVDDYRKDMGNLADASKAMTELLHRFSILCREGHEIHKREQENAEE